MFFVDRIASHHVPLYAEIKTMESRSTVMIIDLYMSTSQPSPIRMRIVSLPSFSNVPRSGTLISPNATCSRTDCPTHALYAFSMPLPQCCPTHRESRTAQKPTMVQMGRATSKKGLLAQSFQFSNFFRAEYRRTVPAGPLDHRAHSAALAFCKPWHRSNISTAHQRRASRPAACPARRSIPPSCPNGQCQPLISRPPVSKTHSNKACSPANLLIARSGITHHKIHHKNHHKKMSSPAALSAPCFAAAHRLRLTRSALITFRAPASLLPSAADLHAASRTSACCRFSKKITSLFRTLPAPALAAYSAPLTPAARRSRKLW